MNIGDKVIFKSGEGPIMVVIKPVGPAAESEIAKGNVLCKWWSENDQKYIARYFGKQELESYQEKL